MSGSMSKGKCPNFYYDRNDSRAKITVWFGLCGNGALTGPFFFEGNVDGENYLQMLNEEVFPQLVETGGTFQRFGGLKMVLLDTEHGKYETGC